MRRLGDKTGVCGGTSLVFWIAINAVAARVPLSKKALNTGNVSPLDNATPMLNGCETGGARGEGSSRLETAGKSWQR